MERLQWQSWDTVRCVAGNCEMVVGISAGPRILSLRYRASGNLLYQDRKDLRVGDWRLYGGHRFTVAPEGDATYEPDNAPCLVKIASHELCVAAPLGTNGNRRVLTIGAAQDGMGFDIQHTLENGGQREWHGALWGITCVPHACEIVAPHPGTSLRFWPGLESGKFQGNCQFAADHLIVTPSAARGKAGWHSAAGWLASLQSEATLVIHSPNSPSVENCVDDGCNLEVFACADYAEIETLGGRVLLKPGERVSHRQCWRLFEPIAAPRDCSAAFARIQAILRIPMAHDGL
jgi:hypothetical protein